VIEATAVLALHLGRPEDLCQTRHPGSGRERAELAATLLGVAHSMRGCFDEGSLDAPAARDAARALLGPADFEAIGMAVISPAMMRSPWWPARSRTECKPGNRVAQGSRKMILAPDYPVLEVSAVGSRSADGLAW